MRWLFAVLGVAATVAISACAVEAPPTPTQAANAVTLAAANAVTLTKEKDGRFLVLTGPRLRHAEPFLGIASTNFYLLRSFVDVRTGETLHQLYVEDSYPGAERNWNAARLAASIQADPYSVVSVGLSSLGGPFHAVAPQRCER